MWRVRLLRIILPAILVPFLVLVVVEVRRRPSGLGELGTLSSPGARAENVRVIDLEGAVPRLELEAESYAVRGPGRQALEGDVRVKVARDEQSPLNIAAERADVEGQAPSRFVVVDGGLELRDDEAGMMLSLPTLHIDEAAGEARSVGGDVEFEAPGYRGRAESLVYGLKGQPTVFHGLEIFGDDGAVLRARTAVLEEGSDEIELLDDVRLERGLARLDAPRMRAFRDPETHDLRRVLAENGCRGRETPEDGPETSFRADRGDVRWAADGRVETLLLEGEAFVQQGGQRLDAHRIFAERPELDPLGWWIEADGEVVARGVLQGERATMTAGHVEGLLDAEGNIQRGSATGGVRFEGADTLATSEHAELSRDGLVLRVDLTTPDERKSRLANADTRVSADRITTWPGTRKFIGRGRAEATLLPSPTERSTTAGVFETSEAIHFVARELESSTDGDRLTFREGVRGWQGQRNLAADEIVMVQSANELHAVGNVTSRLPRVESEALGTADYIVVAADELIYRGERGRAAYTGGVRLRQAEGWMESERLEIDLNADRDNIEVLRAFENVKLEYRSVDDDGASQTVHGAGDRVEYTPADAMVRLFGDNRPASVRKPGAGGTHAEGRVLRYRLDSGHFEVETGAMDRATIRTTDS